MNVNVTTAIVIGVLILGAVLLVAATIARNMRNPDSKKDLPDGSGAEGPAGGPGSGSGGGHGGHGGGHGDGGGGGDGGD